jgi:hypothetical protein
VTAPHFILNMNSMDKKTFFKNNVTNGDSSFGTTFDGETEEESFLNLKNFLINAGFGDIPLPVNSRRLWWDYLRPTANGEFGCFIWHPLVITQNTYQLNGLGLLLFNEDFPDHFDIWENHIRK